MVSAYWMGNPDALVNGMNLKKVPSGANLEVILPYDEGVFYQATGVDNIPVVSPVQLYLDLANMPGRGEEAAKFLLDQVLKPTWA